MKLCIFYFLLLFSFGRQESLEEQINNYIKQLKEAIPEPITVPKLDVDLDNEYISGQLNVTDFILKGLKNLDIDITFVLSLIPTYFVITIDSINLDLKYLSDLTLFNSSLLLIFGEGTASVTLTNFTIEGKMSLSLLPRNLTISELQMHLNDGKIKLEGLLNDDTFSDTISEILSNTVFGVINKNVISSAIEDALNKLIAGVIAGNSTTSYIYNDINSDYLEEDYQTSYRAGVQEIFGALFAFITSLLPQEG